MTGINPAGCQVYAFKKPSAEELDHDFLWRAWRCLPERGRIGIFNRSYYEEVLVVRVHPELLAAQRLPSATQPQEIWEERFESIREMEQHLHRNGTTIIKFFLHVSKEEQKKRLLARIEDSESNWKFQAQDVVERAHWDGYMDAYEAALTETSRKYAPWYVIPADNKAFMRACVADIIAQTIESLDLSYPTVGREEHKKLADLKRILEDD
jgi:PPK2 family polyphosphate:nucleotide phosphotransferase